MFDRAYKDTGDRTLASISWNGQENARPEIASVQMITVPIRTTFEYKRVPWRQGKGGGPFKPVRVADSSLCVLKDAKGNERLGNLHMKNGKASASFYG